MKVRRLMGTMVLVLALAMGLVGVAGPDAEAAKVKKYTMLPGEKGEITVLFIGSLRNVKSSKKSVVSVKKVGSNKIKVTAKKAGKATITAKGQYGYYKSIITVKKKKMSLKYKGFLSNGSYGYCFYEITNKCGVHLSSATFTYNILDAAGNVLKTANDMYVYNLVPNAKNYVKVAINSDLVNQGATAIKVTKFKANHNAGVTYANYTKKVKVSYNKSTGAVTFKNKAKKSVSAKAYIVFYDSLGNIVDFEVVTAYLSSKGKDTKTATCSKDYASVKVFKSAYV